MKNKLMYVSLALLIIPLRINGSDCDSPRESVPVPHLNTRRLMLRMFTLPKERPLNEVTLLHRAVKRNQLDQVITLIESGVDVDTPNADNQTALALAVLAECQLPIIERLIKADANVNMVDKFCETPLMSALSHGRSANVKALIDAGADTSHRGLFPQLFKALHKFEKQQNVKILIAAKVDVNPLPQYRGQSSPLRLAAFEDSCEMVQDLLVAGARVNDENGDSKALTVAASRNNLEMVKILLAAGARVNDVSGNSNALMAAVKEDRLEVAKILVAAGANVNSYDKRSIMYIANCKNNPEMIEFLSSKGAVCLWGEGLCAAQ